MIYTVVITCVKLFGSKCQKCHVPKRKMATVDLNYVINMFYGMSQAFCSKDLLFWDFHLPTISFALVLRIGLTSLRLSPLDGLVQEKLITR